jgi:RHS repeat-associated protein
MTTLPITDGATAATWTGIRHQTADEFGTPTDLTTGRARTSNGASPDKSNRYGWLGGAQRSTQALAGVTLMGVRLYDPNTGRFWSTDPVPGGNATTYDYCSGDPVNCTDLDGRWSFDSFKKAFKKATKIVAVVAEVASNIPGPIGAASAGISAVAYASMGNKSQALLMGVTAAAALVGAGAAVRAVAKVVGPAVKAGRSTKEFKSSIELGNKAHARFEQMVARRGGTPGRMQTIKGERGKPDGMINGRPLELKPMNARGLRDGERQLQRYERMHGQRGELWLYRTGLFGRLVFKQHR